MEHGRSDADFVRETHNVARYFTEQRAIAWVALIAAIVWGAYGYINMPKRKDPEIPVRIALAVTNWPGVGAEKIEQLVTRPIEERIAENTRIHPPTASAFGIKSISLPGVSIVQIQLDESVDDVRKELSDINLKLNALNSQLPQGAGPIQFNSDFGETDVALVIGANDVVNPVARTSPDSPIYGMPILNVDQAKNVIVIKRGQGKGFSGVENALFYADNARMLYGDGQGMTGELIQAIKAL